jgi:hypothetical protein
LATNRIAPCSAGSGAKRVEAGLAEFFRTEFWRHRWRIYELWTLTLVFQVVEQQGGTIELVGVRDGVWNLRYGRASEPCAVVHFSTAGDLYVCYQLFRGGRVGREASMPDIALLDGPTADARAIAVLDPKHGMSYRRGRVWKTLRRYHAAYRASVTVINNYYEHPSYRFAHFADGGSHQIMASGVRPSSQPTAQLELVLRQALVNRGYTTADQS